MPIHVGCSGLPVKRESYFKALNAVEILPSQEVPPKPASAARWLEEAPEEFAFSLVASRLVSATPEHLPPGLDGDPRNYGGLQLTPEVRALTDKTLETALAMRAKMVVFVTTPQLRPGPRGRETLGRFFKSIDRRGLSFAWEPHGPWEEAEIAALCEELDLTRCFDPLRDEPPAGATAYARLGPFAVMGRAFADDELEEIAEVLDGYDEAYCFFGTERDFSDAQRLLSMCNR